MLSPALAENVLRQLLREAPPQRFQHLMRIIRNDYFMLLDPRSMCRRVLCTDPLLAASPMHDSWHHRLQCYCAGFRDPQVFTSRKLKGLFWDPLLFHEGTCLGALKPAAVRMEQKPL